jgi:hypothetical protein
MKKLLAALATSSLLVLTGCSGSGTTAEAQVLTRAEFIKKADAICADSQARLEKSGAGISADTSLSEIRTFLETQAIPEMTATVSRIRKIVPPSGDEKQVGALLDEIEAEVVKLRKNPMAVMGDGAFASARKLAAAYGLRTCLQ